MDAPITRDHFPNINGGIQATGASDAAARIERRRSSHTPSAMGSSRTMPSKTSICDRIAPFCALKMKITMSVPFTASPQET